MPFPRITLKELLLGIFLILSWIWALGVSEERFQILEIGGWLKRFLIFMFPLTVILTFICVKTFEKPSPGGTKGKRWISLILQRTLLTIVCFVVSGGAALGLLQASNAVFDWKVKKVYQTKLIDTYIHKGKRYYIVVENVWENRGGRYRITISRSRYLSGEFQIGKLLHVTVGEGALGFPWIKKIE